MKIQVSTLIALSVLAGTGCEPSVYSSAQVSIFQWDPSAAAIKEVRINGTSRIIASTSTSACGMAEPALSVSARSGKLAFVNDSCVTAVTYSDGVVLSTSQRTMKPLAVSWSTTGGVLAVLEASREVAEFRLVLLDESFFETSNLAVPIEGGFSEWLLSWSADDRYIAISAATDDEVQASRIVDLVSATITQVDAARVCFLGPVSIVANELHEPVPNGETIPPPSLFIGRIDSAIDGLITERNRVDSTATVLGSDPAAGVAAILIHQLSVVNYYRARSLVVRLVDESGEVSNSCDTRLAGELSNCCYGVSVLVNGG